MLKAGIGNGLFLAVGWHEDMVQYFKKAYGFNQHLWETM